MGAGNQTCNGQSDTENEPQLCTPSKSRARNKNFQKTGSKHYNNNMLKTMDGLTVTLENTQE